jgi:uncharacterized protein (DUF488 family)
MNNKIYSIGYASFSMSDFLKALSSHRIDVVADVRSQPYSRFKPEFNRENLISILKDNNIGYAFLGDQCGARIGIPECYIAGKIDFNRVRQSGEFQRGLRRLQKAMENYRIAIMCAERDPINCHRTILICRSLRSEHVVIKHIVENGLVENHLDTEKRLIRIHKLDQSLLYPSDAERLEEAYNRQGEVIAYTDLTDSKNQLETKIGG